MNAHYPEVARRAGHRCEYCRAPEAVFNFPFEVEHVIPTSHGGADEDGNLCLACRACNLRKSNRLAARDEVERFHDHSLPALRGHRRPPIRRGSDGLFVVDSPPGGPTTIKGAIKYKLD